MDHARAGDGPADGPAADPDPDTVTLRPVRATDAAFLRHLFHDVRRGLFATAGLAPDVLDGLLDMQWDAQRRSWAEVFPDARDRVVERGGRPVGRLLVDESGPDLRVVDIAMLSEVRGGGVGTRVLGEVLAAGDAAGRAVTLSVARDDGRVLAWYRRLGFVVAGGSASHVDLRRDPA